MKEDLSSHQGNDVSSLLDSEYIGNVDYINKFDNLLNDVKASSKKASQPSNLIKNKYNIEYRNQEIYKKNDRIIKAKLIIGKTNLKKYISSYVFQEIKLKTTHPHDFIDTSIGETYLPTGTNDEYVLSLIDPESTMRKIADIKKLMQKEKVLSALGTKKEKMEIKRRYMACAFDIRRFILEKDSKVAKNSVTLKSNIIETYTILEGGVLNINCENSMVVYLICRLSVPIKINDENEEESHHMIVILSKDEKMSVENTKNQNVRVVVSTPIKEMEFN
jgi:hypothetical protein